MSDRVPFKTTPLYRMTASFQEELEAVNDADLEKDLLAKFVERFKEAEIKRDNNFRALLIIDSLLAFALSGRDITIPVAGVRTSEVPALLEILVVLSTVGLWVSAATFVTWLCYSQLIWTLHNRIGDPAKIDPKWRSFATAYNEISATIFNRQTTIRHSELFEPQRGFKVFAWLVEKATYLLFLLAPMTHLLLLGYALHGIYQTHGLAPLYSVLYCAVVIGHTLTLALWFGHGIEFKFLLRRQKLCAEV
ncbi:hypothetical protein [Sinorhizobium meliloti]|uniref:hypothetical protein n=1 Tax=Rhizobium meliloti TaxID=382 RepID=UPI000FDBCF1E|nr:hypothetical protein [Sinorhizobium meliloti]RVG87512.1 hypothetical protein CN218_28675 [Sinorhizobium meliloti]